jgi:hypothetical protein
LTPHRGGPALLEGEGFRIRLEPQPGYLRAYVFDGEDSLDVSIAMWRLLGEECRLRGVNRLLVVEDLAGTLPPEDAEALIAAIMQLDLLQVRVAFVELRGDLQINEHVEILAVEQGLTAHVFSREAEARHWLLYGG